MDVSQLCTSNFEDAPVVNNIEESSKSLQRRNPSNLQFILSPNEDSHKSETSDVTSIEEVLVQCSKLCENIWQLKLQNKALTEKERDDFIDNLSSSAKSVFKAIQSTKDWVPKDNFKKRDSSQCVDSHTKLEEEEEEDEEDEEETEEFIKVDTTTFNDYAEYELIRQARNIQNSQSRSKYRRRNRRNMIGQKCHSCGTTETPEWRRGPDGARTLCNACGLHYSKLLKRGSIAVQTQNYLLTGGSPQISQSNETISSILKGQFKSIEAPKKTVTNFPFVMMDPKYGLVEKKSDYAPLKIDSFDTPSTPTPHIRINPGFVHNNDEDSKATSNNTVTPLRIHQWKKNQ